MTKRFNTPQIAQRIRRCATGFPMELAVGIYFLILDLISQETNSLLGAIQWCFPIILVTTWACNRTCHGRLRVLYYAVPVAMIALEWIFSEFMEQFVDSTAFPVTMLITLIVFYAHDRASSNERFSRVALTRTVAAIVSGFFGMLAYAILCMIYTSVGYLFGLDVSGQLYGHTFMLVLYVVIPMIFCAIYDDSRTRTHRIVQAILNYVLNPAILIYAAIFYIYALFILIAWELPKGNVAYMATAFIAASLVGRMSQHTVDRPVYQWLYRRFFWIAIPPLLLFWVGTAYRINEYGFTEDRVYLLIAGLLMTVFTAFTLIRKLDNYRLMLGLLAVSLALFTYFPGISAYDIGIRSQVARARSLAASLNLLDPSTGRFTGTADFVPADENQRHKASEMIGIHEYLCGIIGIEKTNETIGRENFNPKYIQRDDVVAINIYVDRPQAINIDIEGYNSACLNAKVIGDSVRLADGKTLPLPDRTWFSRYDNTYSRWFGQSPDSIDSAEPFIYRTDSYMMVFNSIRQDTEANGWYPGNYSEVDIFFRK